MRLIIVENQNVWNFLIEKILKKQTGMDTIIIGDPNGKHVVIVDDAP